MNWVLLRILHRFVFPAWMLVALAASPAAVAAPKRVLILDPFQHDVAPFSSAISGFRVTLAKELGAPVNVHEVPLNLASLGDAEGEASLVRYLEERLKSQPVDLIVPIAGASAQFAARHRERLFPNTPVLVVAAEPRMIPPGFLQNNATLVTQQIRLASMVEDILQLQPKTKRIAVVFGSSALEKFWVKECRRDFAAFADRVEFIWLDNLSVEQVVQRCAELPPDSFVLHGMFLFGADGISCENNEVLKRLHETASAPVFAYFASEFGLGPVGGRLFQDAGVGERAAHVAIRILRGEPAASIPPEVLGPAVPVYDERELRRWDISESRLPPDSRVEFRSPGFWSQYLWPFVGALSLACFRLR